MKNFVWGNLHGLILFLGTHGVYDKNENKMDWGKCLGLFITSKYTTPRVVFSLQCVEMWKNTVSCVKCVTWNVYVIFL